MAVIDILRLAVLALLIGCCHGNEDDVISHLILLDQMPQTFAANATPELIIRTNYSGKIEFREAESFKVLLNITAPSIGHAYAVSSDLTDNKGTLLLQVYEKTVSGPTFSLQWIFVLVLVPSGIVLFLTLVYVIWWYSRKKHLDIYGPNNYLDRHMYRSRNSMLLGAAAGELLGEQDEDDIDGDDDNERRKMDKLRVSMKPETIIEESEESCDDDRTNPKLRFQVPVSHVQRQRSFRQGTRQLSNENVHGSGILDYPDQSGDELENDLSPERKVADADGCYTPLDDIDDIWHENVVSNSQSTAKLADPRGNLDYNIQTSKSDGDLLGDNKKLSEKVKVIIPPVKIELPAKQKRSPGKTISVPKRAEPNVYQRGLNLQVRRQENDLSSSPRRADKIRAQVHTPEHQYANNSFGHYIELKTPESQLSKSRTSRESNDAYELYTYPADIPMSTFKAANTSPVKESQVYQVPKKPKPVFQSGSPTNFDFNKLDPKLPAQASNEPYSPGKFSMLSEGDSSDDLSDIVGNDSHGNRGYMELADSDLDDLDPPSPDLNINADQMSNASLPLPSPPPMSNQFMPYDTHGQISQLSPRQSLVTPLDSKEYGTCIALTGSPSPGGPYSQGPEKRFVFPPPPSMYNPPQHGAWARRELDFTGDPNAGDYAGLPMNMQPPPQGMPPAPPPPLEELDDGRGDKRQGKRERRTSGGESVKGDRERRKSGGSEKERKHSFGKKGKLPKHLHLTIIMSVCVLSIISGVYSITTQDDITVDIVIYVPPSYPYKNSTIYSAPGKHVKVKDSFGMKWFVSPDPILTNPDKTKCIMVSCEHGCDDNTGKCICRHGYNMKNGKCIDINECLTGMIQCPHPQAGCANKDGSYECLCMSSSNTLYKYEDLCLDCRDPCPNGKYEIQPCKGNNKKICKECTQYCGDNFYMEIPCAERSDAVCYMCKPKCDINYEFEFSQCSATQNRECKDKVRLPSPIMSSNVILDDLAAPNDKEMQIPYQPLEGEYPGFVMKRGLNGFGSEFWIQAQVRESKPVVSFRPVNHSEDMSSTDFTGDYDILNKYCQYPLPAMYDLKFIKHEDVFYKDSDSYNDDSLLPCESDPGSFPGNKGQQSSILCSEPGVLSDVFSQIDTDDYKSTESVWVEKDRRCQQRHESCENCSRSCIIQMNSGGRACAVTADDDSGRSARIPTCVTCCTRDNCTNKCKNYHNNRCEMIRCQKGSLVEFELSPIYPTDGSYYCHIEPVLGEMLLRIEYEVGMKKNSEPLLYKGDLSLYTDTMWQKTGKIQRKDSIIHAEIDSQIETMPTIVKGAAGVINVKVGTYSVQGEPILSTVSGVNNISIQPNKPFGISPRQFGTKGCGDNTPDWESVVTSRNEFFEQSDDLVSIYQGNSTYLVSNKSKAKLRIGLNRDTSLLKAVMSPTKVIYDTLQANMSMNGTHWILLVKGETVSCPGVFSLNLSDPNYLEVPIYQFDVGIECPKQFQLNFTIPTGDARELSKDYQIEIQDVGGSFILRIHTVGRFDEYGRKYDKVSPTIIDSRQTIQTPNELRTEPTHFSILFISVVLGATVLLLFLLLFGLAWKQGIPGGDIQRFRIRHLVLLVVYITVQFIYSLFVSMTVFCLIIIAVNGETSTFLKQYNQQRSVTTALSQLELDIMEQHLFSELTRQNEESAHRKHDCKLTIDIVIADVERLQVSLESQTMNSIRKASIKDLITEHADNTFRQFSRDIVKFRDSYSKYEHFVVNKLNSELESTYKSIQKSQWLRGANYIYNTVSNNKVLMNDGDAMMPFMQWVNMDTDVMNLAKGLRLSLPDLPDLSKGGAALPNINDNKVYASLSKPRQFSTQTVNKWFVQPDIPKQDLYRNETVRDEKTKKVSSLDPGSYSIFLVGMVIIDIFWLLHRMIKACGVGKLLLLGYPIYVDVRENKEGPNNEEVKKINKKPCFSKFRNIANRVLSTLFIPKFIGTIFICLMVYSINIVADKFINRETFRYLGYHNDMEDLMTINGNAINTRIQSHSDRINKVEYKMYEDVTNINIQNHQFVLNLVETQWKTVETAYAKTYCHYLNKINVTASCEDSFNDNKLSHVRPDRCSFPPIQPVLYKRNETRSGKIAGVQLDGFLYNIRKMISDTCYVVVIYLSCVVIKELLGTVLWIYIKRSGFVSLRIIYETDEAPGSANSSTTNK